MESDPSPPAVVPPASLPGGAGAVVAGLGLLYLVSQVPRVMLGVVSGDIEAALNLSATETATLVAVLFLAYGLALVPSGILSARLGTCWLVPVVGALLAASLAGFALAESYGAMLGWRILTGIAVAPLLPAAYATFEEIDPARFNVLAGNFTAFGRAGVAAATLPLAFAVAAFGWRASVLGAAGAAALAAMAAARAVAAHPVAPLRSGATPRLGLVRQLLAQPVVRGAIVFQGISSALATTVLGLWGGPWLKAAFGMAVLDRGLMLFAMALVAGASAPVWGLVANRTARPVRALVAAALVSAALLLAAATVQVPVAGAFVGLAVLGASTGSYPLVVRIVREAAPPGATVFVATVLPTGMMAIIFLIQPATGFLVDQFGGLPGDRPLVAFQVVFAVLAAAQLAATAGLLAAGRRQSKR